MKKVLITGGSGFVGRKLVSELLKNYPDIEVFSLSRSEGSISKLMMECNDPRLKIVMADIRDAQEMRHILKDKDVVIHLAAMKRVDLSEEECRECASINVIGTMNVLDAFQGNTFISMSTDKAVEPVNCYGASKLLAEKLVMERANKASRSNRFMIIRSGNVVGSTGSVMDIWKSQILKSNEITVTDLDMTRFYTSVEGVVQLYLAVIDRGENGKIYLTPRGEAIILRDIAAKAIKLYGNEKTKFNFIGLRHGERMDEKMRTDDELNTVSGFGESAEVVTASK